MAQQQDETEKYNFGKIYRRNAIRVNLHLVLSFLIGTLILGFVSIQRATEPLYVNMVPVWALLGGLLTAEMNWLITDFGRNSPKRTLTSLLSTIPMLLVLVFILVAEKEPLALEFVVNVVEFVAAVGVATTLAVALTKIILRGLCQDVWRSCGCQCRKRKAPCA